jgi:hypothetical protein
MNYKINILNESRSIIIGEIKIFKNPISLECIIGSETFKTQANDYFECLIKLREIFEKRKWILLCNGSRYDVFPSGMARDMGKGLKAYKLEMGKPAKIEDLVNIFEEAEIEKIGTIEEQKEYYKKWVESFGLPSSLIK